MHPTEKSAVDYNRALARARDEITVLNVLRASERQPLLFSTISGVQGSMKSGASIKIPFTNIIAGGTNSISPEVTITGRNPIVSITPLATKEFVQGMSRPIDAQLIEDLLAQGWRKEIVLPLAIGGVVCASGDGSAAQGADERVRINTGDEQAQDEVFLRVLATPNNFSLTEASTTTVLRVRSDEALALLKEGVGAGNKIAAITPVVGKSNAPEEAMVHLVRTGKAQISGVDFSPICGAGPVAADGSQGLTPTTKAPASKKTGVVLRSVLSMYRYLGQAQARVTQREVQRCAGVATEEGTNPLFSVRLACRRGDVPEGSLVTTEFQGRHFYVLSGSAAGADDGTLETLETLALISYLVGLQTSDTSTRTGSPVVITQ